MILIRSTSEKTGRFRFLFYFIFCFMNECAQMLSNIISLFFACGIIGLYTKSCSISALRREMLTIIFHYIIFGCLFTFLGIPRTWPELVQLPTPSSFVLLNFFLLQMTLSYSVKIPHLLPRPKFFLFFITTLP